MKHVKNIHRMDLAGTHALSDLLERFDAAPSLAPGRELRVAPAMG